MIRSNKGKCLLDYSQDRIQRNFNYSWSLVQNLTPGGAHQEFLSKLGWASQCCGTKAVHGQPPKYWSNSWSRGEDLRNEISNCSPSMWVNEPWGKPSWHQTAQTPFGEPRGNWEYRITGSQRGDGPTEEIILMSPLASPPIHRKVLNFLNWDTVSWIWSSVSLRQQV